MGLFSGLLLALGIAYVATVVFLANQEAATGQSSLALRWLLYGLFALVILTGCMMVQYALMGGLPAENGESVAAAVDPTQAVVVFVAAFALMFLAYQVMIRQPDVLGFIKRIGDPDSRYDPTAIVHNVAVILMLVYLAWIAINYDPSYTDISANPVAVLLDGALNIAMAFLGVGLAIRRDLPQSLARLGLRLPTPREVLIGVGVGLGLLVLLFTFNVVWEMLASPETVIQQTESSQQFALQFNTLLFALIASLSAAFGEEILIRGALQPIFGLLPTSVFFALLHTQYWITPGLILILIIALILGWLRRQYNTSTAIIAHFVYNFIQLTILIAFVEAGV